MDQPTFAQWLATLSDQDRERASNLLERFVDLKAKNPEDWVRSEVGENIAQLARFLVLRRMWTDHIDGWANNAGRWIDRTIRLAERDPNASFADTGPALRRIAKAGIDPGDVGIVARMIAYQATFGTLSAIDEGHDPDADDDAPQWVLCEADSDGNLTGRQLRGLHESILGMDPTGRDGRPG